MDTLRQILRMRKMGISKRSIPRRMGVSRNTVKKYLALFEASGHSLEQLMEMDDYALWKIVAPGEEPGQDRYSQLKARFERMEKDLRQPGMTKELLWKEYFQEEPSGYSYSQFCHYFQLWLVNSEATMHFNHKAGDKLFVDFAGKKLSYVDPETGEAVEAEIFVAILGASQLTYVEAIPSQRKEDFLAAMSGALEYFGGVPLAIVPDNLKAAVTRPDRYEPELNPAFADWARYYGTTILPARAAKPRDKSLVEGAVKLVYQRIYAPLRNQSFRSIRDLNRGIRTHLEVHNERPFQRREYSRRVLFLEIELSVLAPLPPNPYEVKQYIQATVAKNGHIWLGKDKHYYSVPYRFIGNRVDVYFNAATVEIFLKYQRIAFHQRDRKPHAYSTSDDHMASNHKFVAGWSPEKFTNWARNIGPNTHELIKRLLAGKAHPEQAYKSCLGILTMAKKEEIGKDRLEKACKWALSHGHHNYKLVKRILDKRLEDTKTEGQNEENHDLPDHDNTRGADYYE